MNGFFTGLRERFSVLPSVSHCEENSCFIVTPLTDGDEVERIVEPSLYESEVHWECLISVGMSEPFGPEKPLFDAFMQARRICDHSRSPRVGRSGRKSTAISPVVGDALLILSREYSGRLTIGSVAERLFVSESHLTHEFKKNMGMTFNECLTAVRIIKAKTLIREGRKRICEIAEAVGFSDAHYFSKLFKKSTGMTPTEYADTLYWQHRSSASPT